MTLRDCLGRRLLLLDGGTGTQLQARGLKAGESPECWNLERREDLIAIHRSYYEAGADLVMTNTFGANRLKLHGCPYSVAELVTAAVENLRAARDQAGHGWLGLDIGPTGRLLAPMGDLDFDEARAAFAETIQAGAAAGADAVVIETMTDLYELKAAVLAAKESCSLPVLATVAFSENGRLLTGGDPAALVALLEGLGVDALGLNCGAGPLQLSATVRAVVELASVPVIFKPNAGLPHTSECGCVHYDIDADTFATAVAEEVRRGVWVAGGCCGTTPAHIAKLRDACAGITPAALTPNPAVWLSSGSQAVDARSLDLSALAPIAVPGDPDDLLDVDRGAEEGWEMYKGGFEDYLKWLSAAAPDLRKQTGTECAGAIQRYSQLTVTTESTPTEWTLTLGNFVDEGWLFFRANEGTPGRVTGGELTNLTGNLYLLKANADTIHIEKKGA